MNNLKKAYELGWIQASKWAEREDLIDDIGSPTYVREADAALADQQPQVEDYKTWYDEAMCASNEVGFAGVSAADTIRELARELAELKQPQAEPLESLLSIATGLLIGYEDGQGVRKPYKPGSAIANFVDECVERLKDWPPTAFTQQPRAKAVQDDLITIRKPATSAEALWLLKLARLVISDVNKTLDDAFAPAQPQATTQHSMLEQQTKKGTQ